MISVVDYGMGNLGSICNMLKKIGVRSSVASQPDDIVGAEQLILPGVGSFDAGMEALSRSGLAEALTECVVGKRKTPILGICLGMQLMTNGSEEGLRGGLGWVDAQAVKFRFPSNSRTIPHMGWNTTLTLKSDRLTDGLAVDSRYYFVHSYYVQCAQQDDVLLETDYGRAFHSGFSRNNIWGVQFHPEKSHRFGMDLLRHFAEQCGA